MRHRLTRNLGWKILSLVTGFLIWILVVNVDNPTKSKLFRDVNIQIINEDSVTEIDKAFDIVSDDTATLKVTERRRILESLSPSDFTVVADMENLTEMNTVPLTVSCSNPSVTFDEITIVPSSLKVELEQIMQSEFVITVETVGTPRNGYEVGTTEVEGGKTVQIAGPQSLLDRIGQVTASVNVDGLFMAGSQTSELTISDKNGDELNETQMNRLQIKDAEGVLIPENTVTIELTPWEVLNDIPVKVKTSGTPAEGYEIVDISTVPTAVSLAGTPEALAGIGDVIIFEDAVSVEGATESVTEELDLATLLEETEDLRLAQGVDSMLSVTVQIEENGDQVIQLPLSDITVKNRPENMTLTFSPADELSLTVHSEESGRLRTADIQASIDLSVCSKPGDYEIPVEITLPEGYTLVSEVSLLVNSAEPEQIEEIEEALEE